MLVAVKRRELAQVGAPLHVGATGELSLAISHRWHPGELFVILTAYLDEAGTDGRHPFVVVGGYVSTVAKWNDFDLRWRKLLGKKGLSHFHAMDYRPDRPPFNKWTLTDTEKFFADMERLILKRALFGVVVRLEVEDYEKYYLGPGRIKGVQLDSKYGVCQRLIMSFIDENLTQHFGDDFRVNMVLETGDKSIGAGDALRVFNQLKQEIPGCARHFGTLTYGDKKEFPGLQAADSTVSPAHRLERGGAPEDLIPYMEGETLASVRRAKGNGAPVYRVHADARLLKQMRANLDEWKEYRRAFWRDGRKANRPSSSEEA